MAEKKKVKKEDKDVGKMISVRTPQHERFIGIAKREHRTYRNLFDRMMDTYEGKKVEG